MTTRAAPEARARDLDEMLAEIGVVSSPFECLLISRPDFAHVRVGGLGGGSQFRVRHGVTIHCDAEAVRHRWMRQPISEFIHDGHRLPAPAITMIEKLQAAQLPVGCSIMVWTLGIGMNGPMRRDRLLVLEYSPEFDRGTCFKLCRWNG